MDKIVLGTAQFGMDYGINNPRGKTPKAEALEILANAARSGVNIFDTAYTYGESEQLLGEFIRSDVALVKIISKLPKCAYADAEKILDGSLKNLKADKLFGYLIHDFSGYKDDYRLWQALENAKIAGKVERIGFSLYLPEDLERIFKDDLAVDMVQVPYSVFDQRFQPYFAELKQRKIEIYARSIFLQGLVFKKTNALSPYFMPAKGKIEGLRLLSKEYGIPVFSLCLNFVLAHKLIDKIVIGIDNIDQFNELRRAFQTKIENSEILANLSKLRIDDEAMVLPFNWPKDQAAVI